MINGKVLDVFHQSGEPEYGIPSYWAVQYKEVDNAFVSYEYFQSKEEAMEYARDNGFEY